MKLSAIQLLDRLPGLKRLIRNSLENDKVFRFAISRFMAIQSAHLMAHGDRQLEIGRLDKTGRGFPRGPDRDQILQSAARRIIARHGENECKRL